MKIGERFGLLVVLERVPWPSPQPRWLCQCDCGRQTEVFGGNLKRGSARSCGCAHAKHQREAKLKHGAVGTRTHNTWNMMNARCHTPTATGFANYGGRGIYVCERWRWPDGYLNFVADMGERPEGMTLDRIDNGGPYSPENCQWVTPTEQQRHTRATTMLTLLDETLPITDWAKRTGINRDTIRQRIKSGWTAAQCLDLASPPPHWRKRSE